MLNFDGDADRAYEFTALVRASRRGFVDIVDQICDWPDIDLNTQDTNGITALHFGGNIWSQRCCRDIAV